MKISALWITKNEEANIARSMESVMQVADELVVVDTGSTDKTVEIAEGLGARIEHFTWVDDFSAARNYALEQVDGDIIVFLDADEWFQPALKSSQKSVITKVFEEKEIGILPVERVNIDPVTGIRVGVDFTSRIFRGKGVFFYQAIIHEHLMRKDGNRHYAGTAPELVTYHDGYSREMSSGKRVRNLELLEKAITTETDPNLLTLYYTYIQRESYSLHKPIRALDAYKWLMQRPKEVRNFLSTYLMVGKTFSKESLSIANIYRDQVSRKFVKRVSSDYPSEVYAKNPFSLVVPLYYEMLFQFNGEKFLEKLPSVLGKAEKLRGERIQEMEDYLHIIVELYTCGSETAFLFGDRELAFDYASKALKLAENYTLNATITAMLRCIKGLPYTDVILFLNSVLDTEKLGVRESLLTLLKYEGWQDVYVYYMKKSMDAGTAKAPDFWYLLVLLKKHRDAIETALSAQTPENEEETQRILFIALICAQDTELYEEFRESVADRYRGILDMYMGLGVPDEVDFGVVISNYDLVAFASDRATANRMLEYLKPMQLQANFLQGGYYMASGLYNEYLEEKITEALPSERIGRKWTAECYIMTGQYEKALQELESMLDSLSPDYTWFNLLQAVILRADDLLVTNRALVVYNRWYDIYEEWVDFNDVANTGLVLVADTKQERKELAQMTWEEFEIKLGGTDRAPFAGMLPILEKAAVPLMENKCYYAAFRCYQLCLMFGGGNARVYTGLSEVFSALENEELARTMWQKAKEYPADNSGPMPS